MIWLSRNETDSAGLVDFMMLVCCLYVLIVRLLNGISTAAFPLMSGTDRIGGTNYTICKQLNFPTDAPSAYESFHTDFGSIPPPGLALLSTGPWSIYVHTVVHRVKICEPFSPCSQTVGLWGFWKPRVLAPDFVSLSAGQSMPITMLRMRHAAPAPISTLLEVRLGGSARRTRRIASLHGAVLELRSSEVSPPTHRFCVLGAEVDSMPSKLGLILRTRDSALAQPATVRLYLFTHKKHAAWVHALGASSKWRVEQFYTPADASTPLLGSGLFATVRAARDNETGEPVAVKTVMKTASNPHAPMHPKLDVYVQRELRIVQLVEHESIVRYAE
jgi:hypothetical protein